MLDLTFGPSFKVKRWFTGFGELSFRWIQICIGSPMRRSSSLNVHLIVTISFYPTAFKGCTDIGVTHGGRGVAESLSRLYLRKCKVYEVCYLGGTLVGGCRCAT